MKKKKGLFLILSVGMILMIAFGIIFSETKNWFRKGSRKDEIVISGLLGDELEPELIDQECQELVSRINQELVENNYS